MASTLHVEVVTPERMLFSDSADMVEAPGVEGDFGILPQHAPFVSLLRPGLVKIHHSGKEKQIFVASGLAQIDGKQCIILAEQIYDVESMTAEQANNMLADAQRRLSRCRQDSHEYGLAQKDISVFEELSRILSK